MTIVCLTTFGFSTNHASAQTCYRLIDLGEIGQSAADSGPFGINNTGIAVYAKEVSGNRHAFVNVIPGLIAPMPGGCHDLHILSGLDANEESGAHDVNDSDIAVGWATFSGVKHAVVWRIDLYDPLEADPIPLVDLGLLDPDNSTFSEAFAISNDTPLPVIVGDGDILGNCSCGSPDNTLLTRGFWRTLTNPPLGLADGSTIHLVHDNANSGCLPVTSAADVNTDLGAGFDTTGVGQSVDIGGQCAGTGNAVGTYWDNPSPVLGIDLPDDNFVSWAALGISDLGAIVGNEIAPTSAAYWDDVTATPRNIGSLVSNSSVAQRINNNDPATEVIAVAGWHSDLGGADEAALWECSGDCTNLNNWSVAILDQELIPNCTGWQIRKAFDVNDDVSIICWARKTGSPDTEHAVLLEPLINCCPEDLDRDGDVDFDDLDILLAAVGDCPGCIRCIADLDCDGDVDNLDQRILMTQILSISPCGGGPCIPAAQQTAGIMGFENAEELADWTAEVSEPEAVTAGYVFSTLGRELLDD